MIRILITGGRDHRGAGIAEAIFAAIRSLGGDDRHVTLVHGGARGADTAADRVARAHGFRVVADPVTRDDYAHHGIRAPLERNQRMVDAGADICLAFPTPSSRGTWDCARRAQTAGIRVRVHHPDGRVDDDHHTTRRNRSISTGTSTAGTRGNAAAPRAVYPSTAPTAPGPTT